MTAEVGAIDLCRPALAAKAKRVSAGRHGFTQLVCQNERSLVLDIEVTGEGEHALALHLVAEHYDGYEVVPERQLVVGEQRP
jgi:hypothetical protein